MYADIQYYNDPSGTSAYIRFKDGDSTVFVRIDEENADYQSIMALVAAGELTIAPAEDQP
jgi:hypothetical protein